MTAKASGSRRRFALRAVIVGLALIAAGALALGAGATVRAIGVLGAGVGIGVVVAGLFVLAGWGPERRR